ncbi:MAG TPA: hypothetical protein VGR14_12595, partial [Verrucomicrobiae bacterium]|nr:hypothetical protein [Verrucomicrobiae bacterium]
MERSRKHNRRVVFFSELTAAVLAIAFSIAGPAAAQTNTSLGIGALANITSGTFNTAVGELSLNADSSGSNNSAL